MSQPNPLAALYSSLMFMRAKKTACLQAADWVIEAARNDPSGSKIHMEIISSPKKFNLFSSLCFRCSLIKKNVRTFIFKITSATKLNCPVIEI